MPEQRIIKTGVLIGGISQWDDPYLWNVGIHSGSYRELIGIVDEEGYAHFAEQFKLMATRESPTTCEEVDIRPLDVIWEVRDHGGVIGNINVRVAFGVDDARRTIIALTSFKKQNNGPTPIPDKARALLRWQKYLRGEFNFINQNTL